MSFIKTNRALRSEVNNLKTLLEVERADFANAIDIEKSKTEALDLELNGRPAKYGMYEYRHRVVGLKETLKDTEARVRAVMYDADRARTELARMTRHNLALREALTALGGAVIELQDVEVQA